MQRGIYTSTFAMVALVLIFSTVILMSTSVREIAFESKTDTILELEFLTENALFLFDQATSDAIAGRLYGDNDNCTYAGKDFYPEIDSQFATVRNDILLETGVSCSYEFPLSIVRADNPGDGSDIFVYTVTCTINDEDGPISISKTSRTGKRVTDTSAIISPPACDGVDICDIYSGRCDIATGQTAGCTPC